MPYVFEALWQKLGRRLQDDLTLVPLPVTCRYRWTDGTVIDEDAAFWQRPGRGAVSGLRARPLRPERRRVFASSAGRMVAATHARNPAQTAPPAQDRVVQNDAPRRPGIFSGTTRTWSSFSTASPTYNGSSPYRTPAAFNIIAYVEARFGGWYVKGGLYEIARTLERICREAGVEVRDRRGGFRGRAGRESPLRGAWLSIFRASRHRGLQPGRAVGLPPVSVRVRGHKGAGIRP